jgi:DNA-binding response OmpR family regulator
VLTTLRPLSVEFAAGNYLPFFSVKSYGVDRPSSARVDVLLIDDDQAVAGAIAQAIGAIGFTTSIETDPLTAIAVMLRCPPKLVVLEWELPAMDGADVLRVMRGDSVLRGVEVIVFSRGGSKFRALEYGASSFLRKARGGQSRLLSRIQEYLCD